MNPSFQIIPIADLTPSVTRAQIERREHFDDATLRELAASIASVGILQPLVVRPRVDGGFEIVAGERRFLAAQIAQLEAVPANVVDLTDEQLIEAQLVENLQREGLHELAEAEGYEALLQSRALTFTVDDLAAKFGRSRAYIYGRMKLLALCPEARAAFYDGKLTASTALLIARIPTPHVQLEALKELTEGDDDPMTYREARDVIERRFMLRMLLAPWDLDDKKLVPSAGSCTACPKRTGNQPDLFGDTAFDMCTDSACYGAKREAEVARRIKQLRKSGATVIEGEEAVALFGGKNPRWGYIEGFRRADQVQDELREQLAAGGARPVWVSHPDLPDLLEVWREADFRRASAELHEARGAARASAAAGDADADEDLEPRESPAARNARIDREKVFRAQLHQIVRERVTTPPGRSDIEAIAIELVQQLLDAGWDQLVQLWGWEMDEETQASPDALEQFLSERISALSDAEINRLFLDARVVSELNVNVWGGDQVPRRLLEAARAAGIDAEAVRGELDQPT